MAANEVTERQSVSGDDRWGPDLARRRGPRWTDVVAVLAVLAPFVVVGIRYGTGASLVAGGDQALIELDLFDLANLHQGVGLYSRMGWAHPGPAWLVLLSPVYWALGGDGAALVAASLVVHAVVAVLVVLVAGGGSRWHRPVAAAVVLLYVLRMPAVDFLGVWNPFALLLPTALLLLVAGRAAAGSLPATVGTLVVGSYLVQTHVGTVPLVGLVGLVAAGSLALRARGRRLAELGARGRRASVALIGLLLVMWIPPVVQQLTAPPGSGNLRLLAAGLLHGEPGAASPTWTDALSTTGQQLGATVFGWPAQPALVNTAILTPAVIAAVVVQLVGCAVVAVLGWRTGVAEAGRLAAVTGAATVAGLVSVHSVTGLLMNYLVLWITVLPAVLLIAGLWLLGSWAASPPAWLTIPPVIARRRLLWGGLVALGGAAAAAVLAVGLTLSLDRGSGTLLGDQPGAAGAADLALDALPAPEDAADRVFLDIRDVSTWTTATAVALDLERAGYEVRVADEWVYGFGTDRRADGSEQWVVALQPTDPGAGPLPDEVGQVAAQYGLVAVVVQSLR